MNTSQEATKNTVENETDVTPETLTDSNVENTSDRIVSSKEAEFRAEAAEEKHYREEHAATMNVTEKITSVLKETGEILAADWEATKSDIAAGPTDVNHGKMGDHLII